MANQSTQPMPPADAAVHYPPQPVARNQAQWLTFEYLLAMGSAVMSVLLTTSVIVAVFGLWTGASDVKATMIGGWLSTILSLGTITVATGIVTAASLAVLLGVVSFICFGRVSRAVAERSGYTDRLAYKLITYGALILLVVPALVLVAKLVGILISSLLFIGAAGANKAYMSLYLAEFVPYLLGLAVLIGAMWMIKQIINGKNTSRLLSYLVIAAAAVSLIAAAITVAVQVHATTSSTPSYENVIKKFNDSVDD